jgi:hypothetical protein
MSRPLLVIDGDSFAHRAYHALPKSIRRKGNKGAGAIVGFGNFLLRLYESEQPRAVVVGWDTLDAPTHRQKLFAGYQVGRSFDDELIEQLGVLPEFVAACGFSNAKAPGFEADDFLAAAVAKEERRGRPVVVASGDREPARIRAHHDPAADPCRGDGTHWSSARAQALRCGRSRREPATEVSHTGTGLAVRPVPRSSRRVAPLSEDCRHGRLSAAAVVAKPEAEVVGGSEARSRMAAKQACGSAGTAQRLTDVPERRPPAVACSASAVPPAIWPAGALKASTSQRDEDVPS